MPKGSGAPGGEILPWAEMMAFGLGVLRLSPAEFWGMTLPEFRAATRGYRGEFGIADPITPEAFSSLMERFPDAQASGNPDQPQQEGAT